MCITINPNRHEKTVAGLCKVKNSACINRYSKIVLHFVKKPLRFAKSIYLVFLC